MSFQNAGQFGCASPVALVTNADPETLAPALKGINAVIRRAVDLAALPDCDAALVDADADGWQSAESVGRLCRVAPAVIVLIGPVGEEAAVEYMKAGAADCVRKDRLERLAPALAGALSRRRFERNIAGVYRRDLQGRILDCNESAARMLGYESPARVIGRHISEFYFDPLDIPRTEARLRETRWIANDAVRLRARDGRAVPVLADTNLLAEAGPAPVIEGSFFDVAALKQAKARLARIERLYAVLRGVSRAVASLPDPEELFAEACRIAVEAGGFRAACVYVRDGAGGLTPAARAGAVDAGRPARAGNGDRGEAVRAGDQSAGARAIAERALREGRQTVDGLAGGFPIAVQGETIAVLALVCEHPGCFDQDSLALAAEVSAALAFALDKAQRDTERRNAERERALLAVRVCQARSQAAAERRFHELLETAPEAILEIDASDGRIRLVNRAAEELFGYDRNELLGETVEALVPERYRNAHAGMRGAAAERTPEYMLSGREAVALRKDGTEFPAEISLRPIRTEDGPMITCAVRDVSARKHAEQVLRESARKVERILESITDGFFALDGQWRFTYLNGKAEQVLGRKRGDLLGKVLWHEFPALSGTVFEDRFLQAAASQSQVEFEAHGGEWKIWAEFHAYPSEEGIAVYFQDVTARKRLEEQLRHSQRMEAMGLLAGGVAHDFNNLLTIIGGYGHMTLDGIGDSPLREKVEAIVDAAERASSLTRQLLAFSRGQEVQPRVLDLNRLVSKVSRMVRALIGEDIEMVLSLAPELRRIKADAGQMEQVIMNLLVNARDAMPKGGRLTIATVPAGSGVSLTVSDTGSGMTPEVMNRIFEPFFTTKAPGRGTGLGLSMVYGIVKQSGGEIEVDSEPGRGSAFRIVLPAAEDRLSMRPAAPVAAPGGAETILLVEDDAEVRKLARQMLKRQGYRVLAAAGAAEGLRVWRRNRHVDLLLTDVVLPGMSGRQLAEQLRELQAGVKVLFMSGYAGEVIGEHGVSHREAAFLPKPFTREALAAKVRGVLDS